MKKVTGVKLIKRETSNRMEMETTNVLHSSNINGQRFMRSPLESKLGVDNLIGEVSKKVTFVEHGIPVSSVSVHLDNIRPTDLEYVIRMIRGEMDRVVEEDEKTNECVKSVLQSLR